MNNHKNARLTVHGRLILVRRITEEGLRPQEGEVGLQNRSSRPKISPRATKRHKTRQIVSLRKQRQTYRQISQKLTVSPSTVARVLTKLGLNRLSNLEPAKPDNRYEHDAPGDLLHLDIKKLGRFKRPGHRVTGSRRNTPKRGPGWEYVHIAIDDHSRIAFGSMHPDETGHSACNAMLKAVRYYRDLGIRFKQVLTDNGAPYRSKRFKGLCRRLGMSHRTTKPYTPRTNGKAERFIQTALREWAGFYPVSTDSFIKSTFFVFN